MVGGTGSEHEEPSPLRAALLQMARLEVESLQAALEALTMMASNALGVERVGVWFYSADRSELVCRALFERGSGSPRRGETLLARDYPAYFEALSEQRVIVARDARRDLRTRELAGYLDENDVTSMMDVPIWLGGQVVGVLCNEHRGALRAWAPEEADFAIHAADAVSLAFQADQHRKSERERAHLSRAKRVLAAEYRRRTITWRAVVSSITDALWIVDSNSEVLFANDAAGLLLGMTTEDDTESTTNFFERYEIYDGLGERLTPGRWPSTRALRGEVVRNMLVKIVSRSTGTYRFFRMSAAPLEDVRRNQRRAVVIANDLTEEARFDRMRKAFLAAAAHELKTPIAIVLAYAQLARARPDFDVTRTLEAIERGAVRLDRLVRDLLEATTIEHLELELRPVDVSELVRELVEDFAQTTPRHQIRAHAEKPAIVEGDRERLAQVLSNLIDNAIKFSPNGGEIDVSAGAVVDRATIEVRDHGVGIPFADQTKIFSSAYHASGGPPYPGTGLGIGLHLSRELIARHGGTLVLESVEGKGTTARVSLPLLQPDCPAEERTPDTRRTDGRAQTRE